MKLNRQERVRDRPRDEMERMRPSCGWRASAPEPLRGVLEEVPDPLPVRGREFNLQFVLEQRPEVGARAAVAVPHLGCGNKQREIMLIPPGALEGARLGDALVLAPPAVLGVC